jgi:hypothetical protein
MLDNKELNANNCRGIPGGFVGAVVDRVILGAQLTGKWHKVMLDNYYQTVELATHMRDNRNILCAGTAQKRSIDESIHFGIAKRPKPSRQYPKGSLKMCENRSARVFEYAWMDSSAVFFIDPMYGPGFDDSISRKSASGDRLYFRVPKLISAYNKYIHGVNVFDQIRKLFGVDPAHASKKYSVRVFEILFSMVLGQAYNIHRTLHVGTIRSLSHTQFKFRVIQGMMKHPTVRPPSATVIQEHTLVQFPPGSYSADGSSNKRKRVACRECPNTNADGHRNAGRFTNWYCAGCKVGFHPDCFQTYHARTSSAYVPHDKVNLHPAAEPGSDFDNITEI